MGDNVPAWMMDADNQKAAVDFAKKNPEMAKKVAHTAVDVAVAAPAPSPDAPAWMTAGTNAAKANPDMAKNAASSGVDTLAKNPSGGGATNNTSDPVPGVYSEEESPKCWQIPYGLYPVQRLGPMGVPPKGIRLFQILICLAVFAFVMGMTEYFRGDCTKFGLVSIGHIIYAPLMPYKILGCCGAIKERLIIYILYNFVDVTFHIITMFVALFDCGVTESGIIFLIAVGNNIAITVVIYQILYYMGYPQTWIKTLFLPWRWPCFASYCGKSSAASDTKASV